MNRKVIFSQVASLLLIACIYTPLTLAAKQDLIRLFPIDQYDQNIATWINPHNKNYNQRLMGKQKQQRHKQVFMQHYIGDKSPWDKTYVNRILKDGIKQAQLDLLHIYSNKKKSSTDIGYHENYRAHSDKWIARIRSDIDFNTLSKLKYKGSHRAIAVNNIRARALPTNDVHYYSYKQAGQGYPFDNLQMSAIWAGTPVYIIAQTKDKAWSLVITDSYIAWVESDKIAQVSTRFIKQYKLAVNDKLIAINKTKTPIYNAQKQFLYFGYVGSVFPGSKLYKNKIYIPIRENNGMAKLIKVNLDAEYFSTIPLAVTPHNMARLISTLIDRPYGWGNLYFYNDCSSELRSLFTPFGIWLPRHSADQMKVNTMTDLSKLDMKQRLDYLARHGHPLMTLVYVGGHIVLYVGKFKNKLHKYILMSYQDVWALLPEKGTGRVVIGKSVFLPLQSRYKGNVNVVSQAGMQYFQLMNLDDM